MQKKHVSSPERLVKKLLAPGMSDVNLDRLRGYRGAGIMPEPDIERNDHE
jgi:hypothetical protein